MAGTENEGNLSNAIREKAETDAMIPGWVKATKPLWILNRRLRWLAAGHFSLRPTR